ncbi:MAG: RNA polymerase sigma factor [Methylococcaceae bacterium NSP1-2]|nr:MAG: RNA polymerase sigma factor [Methylococcaceae bacterium NSP1-2]
MLLSYLKKTGVNVITDCAEKMTSDTESSNLEIAQRLEGAKLKLINALAQFPVTALWLLSKYEQERDSRLTAEQVDSLKSIKQHYLIAMLAEKGDFANDNDEKQHLIKALSAFPFSFEDLMELTDLIVYGFQTRGLCYSATDPHIQKQANRVIKRLKNLTRLNKLTLSNRLKALLVNQMNESFLFLSDDAMYSAVMNSIVAEHLWLNARRQLVERNIKLVLFIANQYKGGFLDFDDLVQEGHTGLLAAVDKFNYHVGFQFSTYAAYWIRQRISRALSRNERAVRVPCEQVGHINKLFRAKDELLAKTGKEPSVAELANYLKMSDDEINAILSISQTSLPLEDFDTDDEALAPIDVIEQQVFKPPFKQMAQSELESWLELAIKTLNSRESKVICCHFGINTSSEMTLQEIGAELNISRERVRQIQVMAFNKMKLSYGEQLVSFL